jgi:hypothetical protein
MKYYLTQEQYKQIFDKTPVLTYSERLEHMEHFNLAYEESSNVTLPGWWGILEGTEKEIMWFLLQL